MFIVSGYQLNAQNLVFKSDFEQWENGTPIDWMGSQTTMHIDSILPYTEDPQNGEHACQLINSEDEYKRFSTKPFKVIAGETYNFSFWVKGKSSTLHAKLYIGNDTFIDINSLSVLSWAWKKKNFTIKITETIENVEFVLEIKKTDPTFSHLMIDNLLITKTNSLNINNISALTEPSGTLFRNVYGVVGFEAPKNSGKTPFFAANLWIGGINAITETLHIAADTYFNEHFRFGPISSDYESENYNLKYNRTWKVDKTTINHHMENYSASDYTMDETILNWPGSGDTTHGEQRFLAPFIDVNGNNIYDPQNGDYPDIRGDQAVFVLFNDAHRAIAEAYPVMGVEIHGMLYAFDQLEDSALFNTIFIHYKYFNKSISIYNDARMAFWTDMYIGDPYDDAFGTDSLLNMVYAYNQSNMDGNGSGGTYAANPPAQGVMLLNQNIGKSMYYPIGGQYEGSSAYYYNYMNGLWPNGSPLTYGGNGEGGTSATSLMFTGIPETHTGWIMDAASDGRLTFSTPKFTFLPGQFKCFDIALPFARDYEGTNLTSIALLRERAAEIQTFFNSQNYPCEVQTVGIEEQAILRNETLVFPNPGKGELTIQTDIKDYHFEVYNTLGQMVYSKTGLNKRGQQQSTSINLDIPKGIYLYRLSNTKRETSQGKLVIE